MKKTIFISSIEITLREGNPAIYKRSLLTEKGMDVNQPYTERYSETDEGYFVYGQELRPTLPIKLYPRVKPSNAYQRMLRRAKKNRRIWG